MKNPYPRKPQPKPTKVKPAPPRQGEDVEVMESDQKRAAMLILLRYPHDRAGLESALADPDWQAEPLLRDATLKPRSATALYRPVLGTVVWPDGHEIDILKRA